MTKEYAAEFPMDIDFTAFEARVMTVALSSDTDTDTDIQGLSESDRVRVWVDEKQKSKYQDWVKETLNDR